MICRATAGTAAWCALLSVTAGSPAQAAKCGPGDPPGGEFTTALRDANGKLVTAEFGYSSARHGMLRARAREAGAWETLWFAGPGTAESRYGQQTARGCRPTEG